MSHRSPHALLLPLALAGCAVVPKPVAAPAAPPPVIAAPPPAPSADWRDWPLSPGTWSYAVGAARFGVAGAPAQFVMRCDPVARAVVIVRPAPPAAGPRTLRLVATDAARTLAAVDRPDGATLSLAVRDPLLDALAFSRGRILVEAAGTPRLVLPAWAEIGRVVEDCRG